MTALPALAAAALYQWVVLGPGGQAAARAVVPQPGAACPTALVDGEPKPMRTRFAGGPGWRITVCELDVTAARSAALGGVELPLPRAAPSRIAALGDTGCRIKQGDGTITVQDCLGGGWPLAAIARSIAAARPDVIIHLGDYVYRKAPCPPGAAAKCAGSPFGSNWATLEADFFAPAAPMLAAAPLVVPRGNHETCKSTGDRVALGGFGFFLLLDPRPVAEVIDQSRLPAYLEFLAGADEGDDDEDGEPPPAACAESSPAYEVPVGKELDLWVVDSNQPGDTAKAAARHAGLATAYAAELARLQKASAAAGRRAILLSHRPLYALYPGKRSAAGEPQPTELNVTLQEAFERAGRPAAVDLALAGHMHLFQALSFADGVRPATLTVGGGGTLLDTGFAGVPAVMDLSLRPYRLSGNELAVRGFTAIENGFLLLHREERGWTRAELRGPAGDISITCMLQDRRADCAQRVSYIDVHAHPDPANVDGAIESALAIMARENGQQTFFLPPPFTFADQTRYDAELLLAAANKHPGKLAVLGGGGTLNAMIQEAVRTGDTGPEVRRRFRERAEELVRLGVVGFGEMTAQHFRGATPYQVAPADHPLFLLLAEIGAHNGVPIDLHMEAVVNDSMPWDEIEAPWEPPTPAILPGNIAAFERLLAHQPRARILWAHAGADYTGQRTPALCRRLLRAHDNLYLELKIDPLKPGKNPLLSNGVLEPVWLALFQEFPDRFVIGSDQHYPEPPAPLQRRQAALQLLSQLPADLRRRIGHENASRLFSPRPK